MGRAIVAVARPFCVGGAQGPGLLLSLVHMRGASRCARRKVGLQMAITKAETVVRTDSARVGFIGFGNMASAMAEGFIRSGKVAASRIYACAGNYQRLVKRAEAMGIRPRKDAESLLASADVIIVAVKPHVVPEALAPIMKKLGDKPVVSVAAGWPCARYDDLMPGTCHLSIMPNTPVAVNEGVIICEASHTLTERQEKLVRSLLESLGTVQDVDSSLMSIAGTVTGCSPAFIAMVIESLADAAVKHGIPRAAAYPLVSQTVAGTAKLQLEQGTHPGVMKDAVCSPGGTTIRGVAALEEAGLRSAFIKAIDAIEG